MDAVDVELARLVRVIHSQRPAWMRDAACLEHPELDFVPSSRQRGAPMTYPPCGHAAGTWAEYGFDSWGDLGCTAPGERRGLCPRHYVALRRWTIRHERPLPTRPSPADVCAACLVRDECGAYGAEHGLEGVWGGLAL